MASPAVFEMLGPKRTEVMTLIFRGHVTSSIPHRPFPICFFRHFLVRRTV